MSTRRSFGLRLWCALSISLSGATLQAADSIRIVPVVRDDRVLISCELTDGFTDDVRATIHSGMRTTFTYAVELRMEVLVWVDRTIASAVVSVSDEYDNLTRRHSLVRMLDGRVEEAVVTENEAVVRRWMTSLDRLPLFRTSLLEPNREYYVRVRARGRPLNASLWPWSGGPSGQAPFTFIP
jgi:hypothetical protein